MEGSGSSGRRAAETGVCTLPGRCGKRAPSLTLAGVCVGNVHCGEQYDRIHQNHKRTKSRKKMSVPAPFFYMIYFIGFLHHL